MWWENTAFRRFLYGNAPKEMELSNYIGQEAVKRQLRALIDAAKSRLLPLPHILLCGRPGIGKGTLARALAFELKVNIQDCTNPLVFERPGDLASLITNLEEGDLLVIREIESIRGLVLECLIQAVKDFQIDIMIGQGPAARAIKLDLRRFTLIGTTSKPSQVDRRLRRSMIVYDFGPYNLDELTQLIELALKEQGFTIDPDAVKLIAMHGSKDTGTLIKRIVSHLAERHITSALATETLEMFGYLGQPFSAGDLATRLQAMNALEFEEYVASLFQAMGYAVDFTPASGDHGIDLLLRKDNQLFAVQCKRWNAPVGEPVLRDFFGSLTSAGAQSGYIVTSATFSSRAFAFAQGKPIQLIDLDGLLDLARSAGIHEDSREKA